MEYGMETGVFHFLSPEVIPTIPPYGILAWEAGFPLTHSASPLWLSSSHSPLNLKIGLLFYVSFLSAGDSSHGMSSSTLIPVLCLSLNASVQNSGIKMFASEGTYIHWEVLQKQHCVICVYLWFGLIKIEVIVHIMLCFFCFNISWRSFPYSQTHIYLTLF